MNEELHDIDQGVCLWGQYSLGGFEAELLSILEVLFWSLGHTKPLIRLPFLY